MIGNLTAILKFMVHASPLVPLLMERYYFSLAAVVMVFLLYIKRSRLLEAIIELEKNQGDANAIAKKKRILSLYDLLTVERFRF